MELRSSWGLMVSHSFSSAFPKTVRMASLCVDGLRLCSSHLPMVIILVKQCAFALGCGLQLFVYEGGLGCWGSKGRKGGREDSLPSPLKALLLPTQ